MYNYVSIDIGIINMGFVSATINEDYTINEITHCALENITESCNKKNCDLPHGNNMCDRMIHFFEKYKDFLEQADKILIELQPPQGLIVIQELIRFKYHEKTETVSPRSMHCHYGIQGLDYDQRKAWTTKFAIFYLSGFKEFVFNTRKNDMGDSTAQLCFYLNKLNKKYLEDQKMIEWRSTNKNFIKNIDSFMYIPREDSLKKNKY